MELRHVVRISDFKMKETLALRSVLGIAYIESASFI